MSHNSVLNHSSNHERHAGTMVDTSINTSMESDSASAAPAVAVIEAENRESSPLLLRTWQTTTTSPAHNATADNDASTGGILRGHRRDPSIDPPVAPAIVVDDASIDVAAAEAAAAAAIALGGGPARILLNSSAGGSGGYSYPVATFVRDLVRTSIDNIHQNHGQHFATMTMRSDTDLMSASAAAASVAGGHGGNGGSATTPAAAAITSVRTDWDDLDNDAEYIVVDGDLIALPPPPPNDEERTGLEENLRDLDAARKSCQGSRLRRGVRKLNKLFKRTRKHQYYAKNAVSNDASTSYPQNAITASAMMTGQQPRNISPVRPETMVRGPAAFAAADASSNRDDTPSTSSPSRHGKGRKHKKQEKKLHQQQQQQQQQQQTTRNQLHRRSWRRTDSNEITDQNTITSGATSGGGGSSGGLGSGGGGGGGSGSNSSLPPSIVTAATGDSASVMTISERSGGGGLVGAAAASLQAVSGLAGGTRRRNRSRTPPPAQGRTGMGLMRHQKPRQAPQSSLDPEQLHAPPPRPVMTPVARAAAAVAAGQATGSGGLLSSSDYDDSTTRMQSVTASFVGTADQLLEAGILSTGIEVAAAEAYVEFEDSPYHTKKDDDSLVPSLVPRLADGDLKVDKADAPDVEAMLRRAAMETEETEETTSLVSAGRKSDHGVSSIPLSLSCGADSHVHNDVLKVVMVGCLIEKSWMARAIRGSKKTKSRKRSTLALDVHTWCPENGHNHQNHHHGDNGNNEGKYDDDLIANIKYSVWDVQGATVSLENSPNFGGHPATQSLFFSAQSLYVLVWDMAGKNVKTYHRLSSVDSDNEDDDDDEYDDEFGREEWNRQADRLLQADIQSRVLTWVDCIARRGPHSAILPVAVIPESMSENEVRRRSNMMQALMQEHIERRYSLEMSAPKLLMGAEDMLCVDTEGRGIEQLQDTIVAIGTDSSRSVFQHVGSPVPYGTALVLDIVRRLKQDHKLVLIDYLVGEIGSILSMNQISDALHFLSSIGEILYFGTVGDEVLSRFVILSRKWLVSALSCILRNDLKRELEETRRFMNMQCLYSNDRFVENEVAVALAGGLASSCPLLSDRDAKMLWQSMSFMREAADRYSQLSDSTTTTPTIFYFLERLLVHSGVLVPLGSSQSTLDRSEVFFVPSLLAQVDPRDIWTYRSSESWMATLCHSWLFRDGAHSEVLEDVTVNVLRDLFDFTRSFQGSLENRPGAPARTKTVPIGRSTLHAFYEEHNNQVLGRVRIHQIMCWQSSVLVKIGAVFADPETDELKESFIEVLITLVDQSSDHCVASDAMRPGMHRVIVSGKGQVGHHGRKLWKGGYKVILDSVRSTLDAYANVDAQVICPECLAQSHPHSASTWSWDSVQAAAESRSSVVRCMRGHRIDSNLICGTYPKPQLKAPPAVEAPLASRDAKPVTEIFPSVVLVGLWDPRQKKVCSIGSGFVVDRKQGLVVTAAHVLFDMDDGRNFGTPYFGIKDARAVVGIIPDDGHDAVFRYFASIVADDINSVDACVLRICSRMEQDLDVDDMGSGCASQKEKCLDPSNMPNEQLRALKMTTRFELEESVRILGFNQGGEGVFKPGKHVNRTADFAKGYICKKFTAHVSDDSSSHSSDSSTHFTFSPREEIVVIVPTISGHSGGACVNDEGKVVGILSRADPVDRQRCYLVPATELKILVSKARKQLCACPQPLMNMQTKL